MSNSLWNNITSDPRWEQTTQEKKHELQNIFFDDVIASDKRYKEELKPQLWKATFGEEYQQPIEINDDDILVEQESAVKRQEKQEIGLQRLSDASIPKFSSKDAMAKYEFETAKAESSHVSFDKKEEDSHTDRYSMTQDQLDKRELTLKDKVFDLINNPEQLLPYVSGAVDVSEMVTLMSAARRAENGNATELDIERLRNYQMFLEKDKTVGYKVLDTISKSFTFGLELASTWGFYNVAKTATVKSGKKVLSYMMKNSVDDLLKQGVIGKVKGTAIKYGGKAIASAVGAAPQSVISGSLKIPANVLQRQLPYFQLGDDDAQVISEGQPFKEALIKSVFQNYTEVLSEHAGAIFEPIGMLGKSQLMKIAAFRAFMKTNPAASIAKFNKFTKKFGWDGIAGEIFEERFGEGMSGAGYTIGLSDEPYSLPSKEDFLVELLSFSVPGITTGMIKESLRMNARRNFKKNLKSQMDEVSKAEINPTEKQETPIDKHIKLLEEKSKKIQEEINTQFETTEEEKSLMEEDKTKSKFKESTGISSDMMHTDQTDEKNVLGGTKPEDIINNITENIVTGNTGLAEDALTKITDGIVNGDMSKDEEEKMLSDLGGLPDTPVDFSPDTDVDVEIDEGALFGSLGGVAEGETAQEKTKSKPIITKKSDIENRRQEELGKNAYRIKKAIEKRSYTDDDGIIHNIIIVTNKDGSYMADEEQIYKDGTSARVGRTKYSKNLSKEKIYDTYNGDNYEYSKTEELPLPKSKVETKINAKYDAEIKTLEKTETGTVQKPKAKVKEINTKTIQKAAKEKVSFKNMTEPIINKSGREVGATYNHETKIIRYNEKKLKQDFKTKEFTKPKVKGVIGLNENTFQDANDYVKFALYHEISHQETRGIKDLAARENKTNVIAFQKLLKDNSVDKNNLPNIKIGLQELQANLKKVSTVKEKKTKEPLQQNNSPIKNLAIKFNQTSRSISNLRNAQKRLQSGSPAYNTMQKNIDALQSEADILQKQIKAIKNKKPKETPKLSIKDINDILYKTNEHRASLFPNLKSLYSNSARLKGFNVSPDKASVYFLKRILNEAKKNKKEIKTNYDSIKSLIEKAIKNIDLKQYDKATLLGEQALSQLHDDISRYIIEDGIKEIKNMVDKEKVFSNPQLKPQGKPKTSTLPIPQKSPKVSSEPTRVDKNLNIEFENKNKNIYFDEDKKYTEKNFTFKDGTEIETEIILNGQQRNALQLMADFQKQKDDNLFVLMGYAGTGKTTIVKYFIEYLKKKYKSKYSRPSISFSSPTHRANAVLKDNLENESVLTLHSLFGLNPQTDLEEFSANDAKFVKQRDEKIGYGSTLIIDESSMINDELYKFIKKAAKEKELKVIFMGDVAQLAPVKSNDISKVFTSIDDNNKNWYQLTKVERTKDNPLLREITDIRNSTDPKDQFSYVTSINKDNEGVVFTNSSSAFIEEAVKTFKDGREKKNYSKARIISGTNKNVVQINNMVRESLFGKKEVKDNEWLVDDILMGYSNYQVNYKTKEPLIANSMDYLVKYVSEIKEGNWNGIPVHYYDVKLKNIFTGNIDSVKILSKETSGKTINAIGAEFERLRKYAMSQQGRSAAIAWQALTSFKDKFMTPVPIVYGTYYGAPAVKIPKQIDFGYAHTIHKSQGGTYDSIFIDSRDIEKFRVPSTMKQLRYVALSRARSNGIVLTNKALLSKRKSVPEVKQKVKTTTPPLASPTPTAQVKKTVPAKKQGRSGIGFSNPDLQKIQEKESELGLTYAGERKTRFGDTEALYKVVKKGHSKEGQYLTTKQISNEPDLQYPKHERITDNPILAEKIAKRLKKHMPNINVKNVAGLIKEQGIEAVGKAIQGTVYISDKGYADTLAHEYSHRWIRMLEHTDIVRQGIKYFSGKEGTKDGMEGLADFIGKDYANQIKDKSLLAKFKTWLRRFYLMIKKTFGKLTNKQAAQYASDLFYKGYKGKDVDSVSGIDSKNNNVNSIYEEVDYQQMDMDASQDSDIQQKNEAFYSSMSGTYLTQENYKAMTIHAANHPIKSEKSIDEFINTLKTFFDNLYGEENHSFNPKSVRSRNQATQFLYKTNSKIPVAKDMNEAGRVNLNMILTSKGKLPKSNIFQLAGDKNLVTKINLPDFVFSNFPEQDGLSKRVFHVSNNDIVKLINGKNGTFYKTAKLDFTEEIVNEIQSIFHSDFMQNKDSDLLFFLGSKSDDNGTILIGRVARDILKMTRKEIREAILDEHSRGILPDTWKDNMLKDVDNKDTELKWLAWIVYGRHKLTQTIKGEGYANENKTIQDLFKRFKIDFTAKATVYGLTNQKMMVFNHKTDYIKVFGEKKLLDTVDGQTLSGTRRLFAIQRLTGRNPETKNGSNMYMVKTAIRYLSPDLKDYFAIKHNEFAPHKSTEFFRGEDPEPYATVKTDKNGETYFVDRAGNEFDLMTDTNSMKQSLGIYGKDVGLHKVLPLPDGATKINNTSSEKGSDTSAGPITFFEQIYSQSVRGKEYDNLIKAMKRFVDDLDNNNYTGQLLEAETNPELLRKLFYSKAQKGQLSTDLQILMDKDTTGKSLFFFNNLSQIQGQITNKIYINGLHQMRQESGKSSHVTLKAGIGLNLKDDEFAVGSELKKANKNNVLAFLNSMLLAARFPIQKPHAVTFMKNKGSVEGGGPNVVYLTDSFVKYIIEADLDGDSLYLVDLPDYLTDAIKDMMNLKNYIKRNMFFDIDIFYSGSAKLSPSKHNDFAKGISANTKADGSQGVFVSAKTMAIILNSKDLEVTIDGTKWKVRDAEDKVIMKHKVDTEYLSENPNVFDKMDKQGSKFVYVKNGSYVELETLKDVVNSESTVFLKTSFENSMQFYLQMAVDNGKKSHLNAIGYTDMSFAIQKIFYKEGNKFIYPSDSEVAILGKVVSTLNQSSARKGVYYNEKKKQKTKGKYKDVVKYGIDLNKQVEMTDEEYSESITASLKKSKEKVTVSLKNKPSMTEYLISSPARTVQKFRQQERQKYNILINKGFRNLSDLEKEQYYKYAIKSLIFHPETPLQYRNKNFNKVIQFHVIDKMIDKLAQKNWTNWTNDIKKFKASSEDVLNAAKFTSEVADKFYQIMQDAQLKQNEKDINDVEISYDYNKELLKLIDDHIIDFEKMNQKQQFLSSLYFVTGQYKGSNAKSTLTKLLPLSLMDKNVAVEYSKLFYDVLFNGDLLYFDSNGELQIKQTIDSVQNTKLTEKITNLLDSLEEEC